ncbi:ATP/GTP-binding protein [Desulfoluna sp.]|uniref:AAA family ATPase n=1 Tax=Desulfoluna sp. TaxID=2045199 RepID=UPI00260F17F7|nr:ATP-binding protein [Desulfoluna sp.]
MLKQMTIKNLTVFQEETLHFAPGLNVIIGENGSGKSHLLKAAYAAMAASAEEARRPGGNGPTKTVLQKTYAEKFINVFRPESLGRLVRKRQGRERCELGFVFDDHKKSCQFGFASASKTEVQIETLPGAWETQAPVFLPTRELLTLYPGFVPMYESRYLEFEETWRDTCLLLGAPALRGPGEKKAAELLRPLQEAMGGNVILDTNGRFYLKRPGQGTMEMSLVAEGLRKLAMLARLIGTGSLLDKGYLFWDEPESNLNPRLVKMVARVILELCNNGIQVFVATHSLFLLRELSIISCDARFKKMTQRYLALTRETSASDIVVEQGSTIDELNTLVLLDEELAQSDRYMDSEEMG